MEVHQTGVETMNEQIRVLAERAGGLEVKTVLNTPPAISLNGHEIEKFAQLIVQECIGLLPEDCQSKNGCHTSWVMKEHFGVEE